MDRPRLLFEERAPLISDEDGFKHEFWARNDFPSREETESIIAWCRDHFGPSDFDGRWVTSGNAATVWIRHQRDAFEFKLRWVG